MGYRCSSCAGDSTAVCCSGDPSGLAHSAAGADPRDSGDGEGVSGSASTACSCPPSSATGPSTTSAGTVASITVACAAAAASGSSTTLGWTVSSTSPPGAERSCTLPCLSGSAAASDCGPVGSATCCASVLSLTAPASTGDSVLVGGAVMMGGAVGWIGSSASSPGVASAGSPAAGGITGSAAPAWVGSAASLLALGSGRLPRSRPSARLMVSSTLLI